MNLWVILVDFLTPKFKSLKALVRLNKERGTRKTPPRRSTLCLTVSSSSPHLPRYPTRLPLLPESWTTTRKSEEACWGPPARLPRLNPWLTKSGKQKPRWSLWRMSITRHNGQLSAFSSSPLSASSPAWPWTSACRWWLPPWRVSRATSLLSCSTAPSGSLWSSLCWRWCWGYVTWLLILFLLLWYPVSVLECLQVNKQVCGQN